MLLSYLTKEHPSIYNETVWSIKNVPKAVLRLSQMSNANKTIFFSEPQYYALKETMKIFYHLLKGLFEHLKSFTLSVRGNIFPWCTRKSFAEVQKWLWQHMSKWACKNELFWVVNLCIRVSLFCLMGQCLLIFRKAKRKKKWH